MERAACPHLWRLLTLQRILGHSSLEVVKLYVNLDTRDLLAQQWRYSPVDTLRARLESIPARTSP